VLLIAGCGGGGDGDGGGGGPDPLNIVDTTLSDGVVGGVYGHAIVSTGGTGAYSYSMSGSLPDGLSLGSDGVISGTPTGPAGESDLTVTVTDSGSPAQSDSQAFTLRIAEPLVGDFGTPPLATIGAPYGHAITASGGTPPYQFEVVLPAGLSIDSGGTISGTPAASARSTASLARIADSADPPQFAEASPFRVPVELGISTTALPDAIGGVSYSAQLQAEGGLPGLSWQETGGTAPFSVSASGLVTGTAAAACTATDFTLDVRVTDSDEPAQTADRQGITVSVVPRAVRFLASSAPPVASLGQPYNHSLEVRPGVEPYTFAVTSGALPPGIMLNTAEGLLFGVPSADGTYNFTIQVTDDCGEVDSEAFTIIVRDTPTGRNDSIATATPVGNGTIFASISPSGHPNSQFAPDEDYYVVQTSGASTVTTDLSAVNPGTVDTVVELVNAAGNRLQTCGAPNYFDECMNDDRESGNLDSLLELELGAATTFYIHVVEWRGDARPDLLYRLEISGIN
jgi:hypothetical protein